jgi:hypothetical protein
MKTFYSAEDIEKFADQGQREISVDENTVLTDMAKQTAHMLGIRITEKPSAVSPGAFTRALPQSIGQTHALGGKPKGCQRRPGNKPVPASGASHGKSQPLVDKLVEKIKRINGT